MHIKIFKKIITDIFSDIISYLNVRIIYPIKYPGSTILSASPKGVIHNKGLILKEKVYLSNSLKKLGKHVYIGNQTSILDCESIGNYSCISQGVKIGLTNHPMDHIGVSKLFYSKERKWVSKNSFSGLTKGLTTIGHDVLISANVLIITGIKIGNGAIIGAGAVVTKDVPPYAIVAGVPAKIIGYRFNPDVITKLLELKWWDWEDHLLISMNSYFSNVPNFINNLEQKISKK